MASRARVSWKQALLLVAVGILVIMLAIEIGVRIATHSLFTWGGKEGQNCCATDPMLGRVITYIGTGRHPSKGFTMTTAEHGIRLNGGPAPAAERPVILAVGDSFAFGDGVDDQDTWPAVLEQVGGQRVVNAGMIGFGVDQAVLRVEQLIDVYRPDTIVLGFIPEDVLRCEMSYWSGFSKPYFDVDNGALRFHPAEVPTPPPYARLREILAHSMTLDILFPRFLHWQGPEALHVHDQGTAVVCLLMERLAALGRAHDVRIVVVAYPQVPASPADQVSTKDAVLACARKNDLPALDLFPAFDALPLAERERLFDRHYTVAGYHLVGAEIARFLAGLPASDAGGQ